jgi:phospholipid/cholesterol/gamma-HCH transport system permease protein
MIIFFNIGRYFVLMSKVFSRPERARVYFSQTLKEIYYLGINSLGIVVIISLFIGAVITVQTAINATNPFVPKFVIGLMVRDSLILEFSSTIVCLILAGKVGSNIASEIGTMQVTEQIDALETMGINSASYLILPKIIASVFINPFLVILSMFIGISGGYLAAIVTGVLTDQQYISGIQYFFNPYYVTYSIIKTLVFSFIISSVSSFYGYYTQGGALEVGRASTKAVVYSSILILLFNLILTDLLLT